MSHCTPTLLLAALLSSACNAVPAPFPIVAGGFIGGQVIGGQGAGDGGGTTTSSDGGTPTTDGGTTTDGGSSAQLFSRVFSGSGHGAASAVAVDGLGGVVVVGGLTGSLNPGSGSLSAGLGATAFLARFDSSGVAQWGKAFAASTAGGAVTMSAVAATSAGDILVGGSCAGTVDLGGGALSGAGTTDADLCVARYHKDGTFVFARRLGDSAAQAANAVAVDTQGSVFVAGTMAGTLTVDGTVLRSNGGDDAVLLKLSASGALIFGNSYGDGASQSALALAPDGAGGVIMAGDFQGTLSLAAGQVPLQAGATTALFLGRLGASGTLQWQRSYAVQTGYLAASNGTVALWGALSASVNFGAGVLANPGHGAYLVALDDTGKVLTQLALGDASSTVVPGGLAFDSSGHMVVAGSFQGTLSLGTSKVLAPAEAQPFLARYDSSGALIKGRSYAVSGPAGTQVSGVAMDGGDQAILAGGLQGNPSFGVTASNSGVDLAPFVARPAQ